MSNKTNYRNYQEYNELTKFTDFKIVSYWRLPYFLLLMVYLEFMFHAIVYDEVSKSWLISLGFGMFIGAFFALFTHVFNKIVNAILTYIFTIGACVFYIAEMIYYKIFFTYFSITSARGAGDAMDFKEIMFDTMKKNIGNMFLLILPIVFLIVGHVFFFNFKRVNLPVMISGFVAPLVFFLFAICTINVYGKGDFTPHYFFYERYEVEQSFKTAGVSGGMIANVYDLVVPKKSETYELVTVTTSSDAPVKYVSKATNSDATSSDAEEEMVAIVPQVDNRLDFVGLYSNTSSDKVKNMTAYFSSKEPTYTNEYTGMYEGYNLIYICAESLYTPFINEKYTPTLYKMFNNGFVFNNYYIPYWAHSTIDGEYAYTLSQLPVSSRWMFYESSETYQPYALGNMFNARGYRTVAYHDFNYYYYDRSKTHPNMGYEFKACGDGLNLPSANQYIYSDLETAQVIMEDIKNEDHFNAYFMTYTGHRPYVYGFNMCTANSAEAKELTKDDGLTQEEMLYVAANLELEKALTYMVDQLEIQGKLDNTVFVISPDHYPYGMSQQTIDYFAGRSVYNDKMERDKSGLAIWCNSTDKTVYIDKPCMSIDVLPTVLNLFGFTYDSRLLMGNDILSDYPGLVLWSNGSYITDDLYFNAGTGVKTVRTNGKEVTDQDWANASQLVKDLFYISPAMIEEDYFRIIYGEEGYTEP